MFGCMHYVPILKGKKGEFLALRDLEPGTRDKLTPLIECKPVAWDFDKDCFKETVDVCIGNTYREIELSWPKKTPLFLDLRLLDPSDRMASGAHPVLYLLSKLHSADFYAIPVTSFPRDSAYHQAVRAVAKAHGACLRLTLDEFRHPDSVKTCTAFLRFFQINPDQADLVIDLREVGEGQLSSIAASLVSTLMANISHIPWRTVTVAGSAFPQDLSGRGAGFFELPRTEWKIWRSTLGHSLPRQPTFGDYGILHHQWKELDGRKITLCANIKYTIAESWLVNRGCDVKSSAGFGQYRQLCRGLVGDSRYCGAAFSPADKFIADCAIGGPTGNSTTWVRIGTAHHLAYVTKQVASVTPTASATALGPLAPLGQPPVAP